MISHSVQQDSQNSPNSFVLHNISVENFTVVVINHYHYWIARDRRAYGLKVVLWDLPIKDLT